MLTGIKEVVETKWLFLMVEEAILLPVTQWVLVTSIHQMSMVATGNMMLIFLHQDAAAMLLSILYLCQEKIGTETQINHKVVTSIAMQIKLVVSGAQNSI